jgi:hypothetical protein
MVVDHEDSLIPDGYRPRPDYCRAFAREIRSMVDLISRLRNRPLAVNDDDRSRFQEALLPAAAAN